MANIKEATSNSQQSLRALFINFPANLDITACSLMPSFKFIMCYYKMETKKRIKLLLSPPKEVVM